MSSSGAKVWILSVSLLSFAVASLPRLGQAQDDQPSSVIVIKKKKKKSASPPPARSAPPPLPSRTPPPPATTPPPQTAPSPPVEPPPLPAVEPPPPPPVDRLEGPAKKEGSIAPLIGIGVSTAFGVAGAVFAGRAISAINEDVNIEVRGNTVEIPEEFEARERRVLLNGLAATVLLSAATSGLLASIISLTD